MKPIKCYFIKTAVLLIVLGSMAILYWYWSHKNFDEKCIPSNADGIVMVDVKNIRNYFILSYIKNSSQWQWKNSETKKEFDLSEFGIETPDYLAFFHLENQPITHWFAVAKIENEADFEKEITDSGFSKTKINSTFVGYYSKSLGVCIIKHSSQILFALIPEKQKGIALKIAQDLFIKKLFLDIKKIEKTIGTSNAITLWIKKDSFLEQDGIINVQLGDQEIVAEARLQLKPKYRTETQFSKNQNALMSLGFNFEMIRNCKMISQHTVQINKMIGFDLDSILSQNPKKIELVLNGMIQKKDSAISYSYDDDFNAVEKKIVHITREPSFNFAMQSDNSKNVFDYLKGQKIINNDQVFVNFPLAKTTASVAGNNFILKANSEDLIPTTSAKRIAYLHINFNKLQPKDWNFIIRKNKNFKFIKHFGVLQINLTNEKNLVNFRARLKTKNKNLIEVVKN